MQLLATLLLAATPVGPAPLQSPAPAATPVQSYVEAPGPAGPLKGTMLAPPQGGAPVVLMIPGSGPVDRDGNGGPGLKAASLRLLAEGLAARGIATVRIDKRGLFASAAATPHADAVTIGDYAADVHAWAAAIRRRTGAACVWLLGHSEGDLVALAAGQDGADLCGLILVAAPGRPLGTILAEQLRANPANAPVLDQALAAIAQLEAGRHVDPAQLHPALLPLFRPAVQDFLIDAMAHDPARLIAAVHTPVLILQGERDIQIGTPDARRLKQADPAARLVLLPDTNHVLKTIRSDDRGANIATYADPALPLAPGVIPAIADFVTAGGRAPHD